MEYFELGDLEKFITPELTEKDAKVIGRQLLEGVQVLHGNGLTHRDLKPANIFVAQCAPDWWIKLGDFGISRRICTAQKNRLTCIGTPEYMAPEMQIDQDSSYTIAVDIWSLGCVLFYLLTHQLPFPELKHLRLYWQSRKPFPTDILIKHSVSKDGISLISKMMKSNPADRMTVTAALLHSWVSNQESTPSFGDFDTKSANECSATKSRKYIPASIPKSNLEDNQPFFNAAFTPHTKNRNIPHKNQDFLPYNSHLTSSQNNETVQLRKPVPNKEEHIFDSSDKDINTLESRSNLADFYLKCGLSKEAMQLFQQILEARRRLLGNEHPDTLKVMNDLAKSFTVLGRYQEAMNLYKQALELQKRILGDEHPDTLQSMNGLARSYSYLGQYQEAKPLYEQMLELQKRTLGDEHPDTLQAIDSLAGSFSDLGLYQEAMHLRKQTFELRERILGNTHPDTLQSRIGLAVSYSKLGQYQDAMRIFQQTLRLQEQILGEEHPDTLQSMSGLALLYSKLGQDGWAMSLNGRTLRLQKRILGDEHPDTLQSLSRLAVSYSNMYGFVGSVFNRGQFKEAWMRMMTRKAAKRYTKQIEIP